jgi:tellurite resistance protein
MTEKSGQLKKAIEVLKKVKHWIDYGAGELEPTANTVISAIDTVISHYEKSEKIEFLKSAKQLSEITHPYDLSKK